MSSYDERPIVTKYTQQFLNNKEFDSNDKLNETLEKQSSLQVPPDSILNEYGYLKIIRDSDTSSNNHNSNSITYSINSKSKNLNEDQSDLTDFDKHDSKPRKRISPQKLENFPEKEEREVLSPTSFEHHSLRSPRKKPLSPSRTRRAEDELLNRKPVKLDSIPLGDFFDRSDSNEDIEIIKSPKVYQISPRRKNLRVSETSPTPRLPSINSPVPSTLNMIKNASNPKKLPYMTPRVPRQKLIIEEPSSSPLPVVKQNVSYRYANDQKPEQLIILNDSINETYNPSNYFGNSYNGYTRLYRNRVDQVGNVIDGYYYTDSDYGNAVIASPDNYFQTLPYIQTLQPYQTIQPIQTVQPIQAIQPIQTVQPITTIQPVQTVQPTLVYNQRPIIGTNLAPQTNTYQQILVPYQEQQIISPVLIQENATRGTNPLRRLNQNNINNSIDTNTNNNGLKSILRNKTVRFDDSVKS